MSVTSIHLTCKFVRGCLSDSFCTIICESTVNSKYLPSQQSSHYECKWFYQVNWHACFISFFIVSQAVFFAIYTENKEAKSIGNNPIYPNARITITVSILLIIAVK